MTIFHPTILRACAKAASTAGPGIISALHEDPHHVGARPDLKNEVIVPDILIQPQSAPMQMMFYSGDQFPAEYKAVPLPLSTAHGTGPNAQAIRLFVAS